jgi:hypothetical protein
MLTDTDIKKLSKAMEIPLVGVFFKDELPKKIEYNKGYIINLDDSVDNEGNDNEGSHWTALQVNKYPNGKIEPIFFDPFGAPPSESIKKFVLDNCGKYLPYTTKDIQSLMNNACGFFCCAFLHYINCWDKRTKDLYTDVDVFLCYFDDLNKSIDFKKNEYVLKHFFRSKEEINRKPIDVFSNKIIDEDEKGKGIDIVKIPMNVNIK